MHVHVSCPDGEAKFWLEPVVALAHNYGISQSRLKVLQKVVEAQNRAITKAWKKHFRS